LRLLLMFPLFSTHVYTLLRVFLIKKWESRPPIKRLFVN